MATVQETFRKIQLRAVNNPSVVDAINAIIRYNIGDLVYIVDFRSENATTRTVFVHNEEVDSLSPNVALTMPEEVWLSVVQREVTPWVPFMRGEIKIEGDMGIALKLAKFVHSVR